MKLKALLLTTALVVSTVAFADASAPSRKSKNQFEDYYAKVELGGTQANKLKASSIRGNITTNHSEKSKVGPVFGIGGGYVFNEFFKTDLMLQYKKNNFKGEKNTGIYLKPMETHTYAAMLNGYLTAHNDTIFTPYLMAGVGVGHNKVKVTTRLGLNKPNTTKTNFIWNLGLGCAAKVADQTSVDLTYRYVDLGKGGSTTKYEKLKVKEIKAHEIVVGLVYHL